MVRILKENRITILGDRKFYCDPVNAKPDGINLISHGHADHLPKKIENRALILSSDVTRLIVKTRMKKIDYTPAWDEVDGVETFPSGHTFGSSMFRFLVDDNLVLYTGDFNPYARCYLEGAHPISCDFLILDATFGSPHYDFPSPEETIAEAKDWILETLAKNHSVHLCGYSLGKAQILCSMLENMGLDYFCSSSVFEINNILSKAGMVFTGKKFDTVAENELFKGEAVIVAPSSFKNYRPHNVKKAVFTGWAATNRFFSKSAKGFPLSDHADYKGLIQYIDDCSPEWVYYFAGSSSFVNNIAEELGIPARSIDHYNPYQKSLREFFKDKSD
ncbi:MAG: hypothetical protein ACFFBD_11845 [Candidatus Hodarchaeota archaeon]